MPNNTITIASFNSNDEALDSNGNLIVIIEGSNNYVIKHEEGGTRDKITLVEVDLDQR